MKFCQYCGKEMQDETVFCESCGKRFDIPVYAPETSNTRPSGDAPSGNINVLQLVWSIINLVMCCMPMGLIALIFTITANSTASAVEEQSKLKTAKILNIIGTAVGAFTIIAFVVFYIIILATMMSEGGAFTEFSGYIN